ncbi:MAG TPA: hypothetical protein VK745_28645 [Polyangiaceae bacterium]|nr:hypothetical protein [Polyangiaceae bacterium]
MRRSLALTGITAGLAVTAFLGRANPARAAEGDVADVDRKYAFIDAELERTQQPAQTWWTVWTTTYSASTLGGASVAVLAKSYSLRLSAGVLAAKSLLGVGSFALTWHPLLGAAPDLHALDARTPEARAARLAQAEALLERRADAEAISRGWVTQIASIGVNLAGGAVLWFGYGQHRAALVSMGAGLAISELQIWTTPRGAEDALRRYRAGDLTPRTEQRVGWSFVPWPIGGELRVSF